MKKLDEIVHEHFMSSGFKQEEATEMEILIYLRMLDVAKAYAESKCMELLKDIADGYSEYKDDDRLNEFEKNVFLRVSEKIQSFPLPKFD